MKRFTLIDLQEAYQAIGLVKVDFDETYPHNTHKLADFFVRFKDYPKVKIATALSTEHLLVILPAIDQSPEIYHYFLRTERVEIIYALEQLLNLSLVSTIAEVSHIVGNIFGASSPKQILIPGKVYY